MKWNLWTLPREKEHSGQRVVYRQPWLVTLHLSPCFFSWKNSLFGYFLPASLPCDCPCKWSLEGRLYAQNICANWQENRRGQTRSVCCFDEAAAASPAPALGVSLRAEHGLHPPSIHRPFLRFHTTSRRARSTPTSVSLGDFAARTSCMFHPPATWPFHAWHLRPVAMSRGLSLVVFTSR